MNITDFIVDFIKQGNTVELPGIGTLASANVSAHHDAATGTYYPTRRTVRLTGTLAGNKEVVRGIAERECVTVEIAEMMWANYVDALKDKLRRNPAGHEFPGIGTMRVANGRVAFAAVEGLDLDADKRHEVPLENVAVYAPKQKEDPFAAFDKPVEQRNAEAKEEASAAQAEAAEAPAAESAEKAETAPAAEASENAEAAPAAEASENAEAAPAAEGAGVAAAASAADKEARKAAEKAAKEAAKAEKEREKAEAGKRKAAEKAAKEAEKLKKEQEEAAKKAVKQKAEAAEKKRKEAEKAAKKAEKKAAKRQAAAAAADGEGKKRKKKRAWLWVVLLLLALLAGGGACYYFAVAGKAEARPAGERIALPYYSAFSRDLNMLSYEEADVEENVDKIHDYVSDYIHAYLAARHYGNAYALFMLGIDQYANDRLHVIMTDDCFAVQRFFPFDDYYRSYCLGELTQTGKYVKRCIVQGEIFDTDRLDAFLDRLIAEKGLHPDGNYGAAAPRAAAKPAKAKPAPAYRPAAPEAPTLKASKQGFDIIAGFFTQKSSANKMTSTLKGLGCDAYVINRSGLYYVSMGSAPTYTAAQELERHIKSWYQGDTKIKNWNE